MLTLVLRTLHSGSSSHLPNSGTVFGSNSKHTVSKRTRRCGKAYTQCQTSLWKGKLTTTTNVAVAAVVVVVVDVYCERCVGPPRHTIQCDGMCVSVDSTSDSMHPIRTLTLSHNFFSLLILLSFPSRYHRHRQAANISGTEKAAKIDGNSVYFAKTRLSSPIRQNRQHLCHDTVFLSDGCLLNFAWSLTHWKLNRSPCHHLRKALAWIK